MLPTCNLVELSKIPYQSWSINQHTTHPHLWSKMIIASNHTMLKYHFSSNFFRKVPKLDPERGLIIKLLFYQFSKHQFHDMIASLAVIQSVTKSPSHDNICFKYFPALDTSLTWLIENLPYRVIYWAAI